MKIEPKQPNPNIGRAIIWNQKCLWCEGVLFVPRAGTNPKTCSDRCRKALSRHRRTRDGKEETR